MADSFLIKALQGKHRTLCLCNRHLRNIPKIIGNFPSVCELNLKNNILTTLPIELTQLLQLQALNLGNNNFTDIPELLHQFSKLNKLHLFGNKICHVSPLATSGLRNLTFLNLNNNSLQALPPEISKIQFFSVNRNELRQLPVEFCTLITLREFHASDNLLTSLPLQFGFLSSLQELYLQKNKLRELPETWACLGMLGSLFVERTATQKTHTTEQLSVLSMCMKEMLPVLPLTELHCEENPLLQQHPVFSIQEDEVMALKEIAARLVMRAVRVRYSNTRRALQLYPELRDLLSKCSNCAVCDEAFLNTWLECVRFVDGQSMKLDKRMGKIPVRALLCSYRCFNSFKHDFYGVAFP